MIVIFQLLCPIIIVSLILFCPESPRWDISKGNVDRARRTLLKIRDTEEEVEQEIMEIKEALEYEKTQSGGGFRAYKLFWTDKSIRWRFFLALVINAGQQLTGQGSLNSYSTIIYK